MCRRQASVWRALPSTAGRQSEGLKWTLAWSSQALLYCCVGDGESRTPVKSKSRSRNYRLLPSWVSSCFCAFRVITLLSRRSSSTHLEWPRDSIGGLRGEPRGVVGYTFRAEDNWATERISRFVKSAVQTLDPGCHVVGGWDSYVVGGWDSFATKGFSIEWLTNQRFFFVDRRRRRQWSSISHASWGRRFAGDVAITSRACSLVVHLGVKVWRRQGPETGAECRPPSRGSVLLLARLAETRRARYRVIAQQAVVGGGVV